VKRFDETLWKTSAKRARRFVEIFWRLKSMGKYKHGKPNKEITLEEFQEALDSKKFVEPLIHRSYLAVLFWIGARRSEPLNMVKEDIREEESSLFLKIRALKHGERGGEVELPLSWLGVDLIKERWLKTRPGRKLWSFTYQTAYRLVKRIWPTRTPHWLRWKTITVLRRLRDQGKVSTDDIKSWTGIKSDRTIEGYGIKSQAGIHKVSQVLNERTTEE
jgi:integrase